MVLSDVSVPEIYKSSFDFRFFLRWFELCLTKTQTDTENLIDLLDPLRCPSKLVWMLADTCGYKYDERVCVAFNRLVILNFASLVRNRGSMRGIIYAAELNLAQFNVNKYAQEHEILSERLDDTSVPANSVSVSAHVDEGYIDVVYVSENLPIDTCIEYVRPLGMYCFSHPGVQFNARTKVSVDARLTSAPGTTLEPGPSFVAHYRRSDYASLQGEVGSIYRSNYGIQSDSEARYESAVDSLLEKRQKVYYRNKDYEQTPSNSINPGLRTLYSLQLSNNEHIVKALLPSLEEPDEIFNLTYSPQSTTDTDADARTFKTSPMYNLGLNKALEESLTPEVYTVEKANSVIDIRPAVNPVMSCLGDAIAMNNNNTLYTEREKGTDAITIVPVDDDD